MRAGVQVVMITSFGFWCESVPEGFRLRSALGVGVISVCECFGVSLSGWGLVGYGISVWWCARKGRVGIGFGTIGWYVHVRQQK